MALVIFIHNHILLFIRKLNIQPMIWVANQQKCSFKLHKNIKINKLMNIIKNYCILSHNDVIYSQFINIHIR
ncbi:hypothetical protein HMPREF9103_03012 [Lentilactobacillus parafarraginis F0439]|uniref:Uncharacterized protein n=1 Tax=Lentilactobacillus parafarraginis F0439 TaxID=797515 RepID=G9ZTC6_9LACO|nr:hypothetical protein HMPREF9103_03012 [Lentilactobacillus parafarraginis F0439]